MTDTADPQKTARAPKLPFADPGVRRLVGKTARRIALASCALIMWLHLVFFTLTMPLVLFCKWFDPPFTGIMLYRSVVWRWDHEPLRFVPLEKIPARFRNMAVKVEDGSFMTHRGILLPALKNAWILNKDLGKPVYGGSTITMQTARTLFLNPEKSYARKYLEMILALEMEWVMGKERILELYLNYAEWGKGVYGMQGAAWHYWKLPLSKLSTDRAVRLVTLLSSPIKYTPETIQKNAILRSRYAYLVKRFE